MNDTYETEEAFDKTEKAGECPFCGAEFGCEHELLGIDATFRTAERGVLVDAFNDRWSALCEAGGDDFDEREPFDNLLEEVEALADEFTEVDQDGGPGQSSEIVVYWAKNAKDQLARFNSNGPMDTA